MSVQFGKWNFDGSPVAPEYFARAQELLRPLGPDCGSSYSKGGVSILYRAFHTTKESRGEAQPHVLRCGAVITWDGRLDNRTELVQQFGKTVANDCPDVSIVAAAYEQWGTDCFARLIGDWALSIWEPHERSLYLAKDFVGTRHLYYSLDRDQVIWSTILDPLVVLAGKAFELNGEYIAGWLSFFPAPHLTPYVGIRSVSPSSFVRIKESSLTVSEYWDFDSNIRLFYQKDADYEEHFRTVFAQSVRRRLRADTPILAELSGGMDSSAIVCMGDTIAKCGASDTPRLDTVSYFDDSEPNWDERVYFTKIEEGRGRTGCHIRVSAQESFRLNCENNSFVVTPSVSRAPDAGKQLAACMNSRGSRVVLSGIGGDEVLGGVPTPTPELADLLAQCRVRALAHQLKAWALSKRKPWFHLVFEAVREFLPTSLAGIPERSRPAPWLHPDFMNRYRPEMTPYRDRIKLFGALPSFQEHLKTLDVLRRQLGCAVLEPYALGEKRYPYLDRDLLQFLYAIPREQLVRPGQRRSLMRRALAGIVPDEILQRRRKAFVVRGPLVQIATDWPDFLEFSQHMQTSSLQMVDAPLFRDALQRARHGQDVAIIPLLRTFAMEQWLRNPNVRKYLNLDAIGDRRPVFRVSGRESRRAPRVVNGD
jgi:asparagine synthase (glutamine-hydrolysing)